MMEPFRRGLIYPERINEFGENQIKQRNSFILPGKFTLAQFHRIKSLTAQIKFSEAELVKLSTQLKSKSNVRDEEYFRLIEQIRFETMFLQITPKDLKNLLKQAYTDELADANISHYPQ